MSEPVPNAADLDVFEPMSWPTTEFEVEISGLPNKILSQTMMEAVLQQAGLDESILDIKLQVGKPCGKALVTYTSLQVVERCIRHFYGCQWDASGTPVHAEVVSVFCDCDELDAGKQPSVTAGTLSADAPVFELPVLQEEPPLTQDWTQSKAVLSDKAPVFVPKASMADEAPLPMFIAQEGKIVETVCSADDPVFLPAGESVKYLESKGNISEAAPATVVISSDTSTEVGESEAEDEQAGSLWGQGLQKAPWDDQEAALVG
jgi:hypothetical protein